MSPHSEELFENRFQTTLLNVETHFDTQIVFRDPTEAVLVPKTAENLSNQEMGGKSTEKICFLISFLFAELIFFSSANRSQNRDVRANCTEIMPDEQRSENL